LPRWIYEDFSDPKPRRCLDIGCAYGTLLLYLQRVTGCEAYGIDFVDRFMSKAMLAKHHFNYAVCNIELETPPWPGPFDIILFTEILEHLNFQCVPTLRKIRGLLSDNGRLYLTTPDAGEWGKVTKYYSKYEDLPMPAPRSPGQEPIDDHVWQFSLPELLECLRLADLKVVRLEYSRPIKGMRHFNLTLSK